MALKLGVGPKHADDLRRTTPSNVISRSGDMTIE